MLNFNYRSDRNAFVKQIKEKGLFTIIADEIKESELIYDLFDRVWEKAFCNLSEEEFDDFVEDICGRVSYSKNDIWEVYFDRSEEPDEYTNDNYSVFIISKKIPTHKQALKAVKDAGKYIEGYYLKFIQESDWEDEDIEESDFIYL